MTYEEKKRYDKVHREAFRLLHPEIAERLEIERIKQEQEKQRMEYQKAEMKYQTEQAEREAKDWKFKKTLLVVAVVMLVVFAASMALSLAVRGDTSAFPITVVFLCLIPLFLSKWIVGLFRFWR